MDLDFFWPGSPAAQAVGDPRVAQLGQLALFVAGNGFVSQTYLRRCPCSVRCFQDDVGQMYSQLANFVTFTLGLVVVLGKIAFSRTVFGSQIYVTVAQWLIILATVATLNLWLHVFCVCLRTLYIRF